MLPSTGFTLFFYSNTETSVSSARAPTVSQDNPKWPPECALSSYPAVPLVGMMVEVPPFFAGFSDTSFVPSFAVWDANTAAVLCFRGSTSAKVVSAPVFFLWGC